MGLSRQRWGDFGVRKQLFLGINFEQDKRGETGGSYFNWIRLMMDLDMGGGFSLSLMLVAFVWCSFLNRLVVLTIKEKVRLRSKTIAVILSRYKFKTYALRLHTSDHKRR